MFNKDVQKRVVKILLILKIRWFLISQALLKRQETVPMAL